MCHLRAAIAAGLLLGVLDCVTLGFGASPGTGALAFGAAICTAIAIALPIAPVAALLLRTSGDGTRATSLVLAMLWLSTVWTLSAGAGISASPWRVPILVGLAGVGVGGLALAVRVAAVCLVDKRTWARLALGCLGAGFYAAGFLYRESYIWLHGTMILFSLCSFFVFFHALLERWPRSAPRGQWVIALLCIVGAVALPRTDAERASLFRHTQGVRYSTLVAGKLGLIDSANRALASAMRGSAAPLPPRFALSACAEPPPHRPDVLFITIDAVRADRVRPSGASVMPHLADLGRRGVHALRAYPPSPATNTSLLSILSSRSALELREEGVMPRTLATELADLGYQALSYYPFSTVTRRLLDDTHATKLGFSEVRKPRKSEEVVDDMLRLLSGPGNQPLFLYAHLLEPHAPYQAHPGFFFGKSMEARYDSELAWVDAQLGRLVSELESSGALDETIIVVSADHGEAFFEHDVMAHGTTLYEEMIRVPLVIHIPGVVQEPLMQPVSLLDLAPTVLAALGCGAAAATEGETLLRAGAIAASSLPVVVRQYDTGETGDAFVRRESVIVGQDKLIIDLQTDIRERYQLADDPGEERNRIGDDVALEEELMDALMQSRRRIAGLVADGDDDTPSALAGRIRGGHVASIAKATRLIEEKTLGNEDTRVLIDALATSASPQASNALERIVNTPGSPREFVMAAQLARAGRMGAMGIPRLLLVAADRDAKPLDRARAIDTLWEGWQGNANLGELLGDLADGDPDAVVASHAALLLCDDNEERRQAAVRLRARHPMGAGLDALGTPQRLALLECLRSAGTDADVRYLIMLYESFVAKELQIAYETLDAMARTGNDQVLPVLIAQSKASYEPIRIAALEALVTLGTRSALQYLHERATTNQHLAHAAEHFVGLLDGVARRTALPVPRDRDKVAELDLSAWKHGEAGTHLLRLDFANATRPMTITLSNGVVLTIPAGGQPRTIYVDWPSDAAPIAFSDEALAALTAVARLSFD